MSFRRSLNEGGGGGGEGGVGGAVGHYYALADGGVVIVYTYSETAE